MYVSELLKTKGDEVVTIAPHASVRDLIALLDEHNIGAVVVSAGAGAVDGIVSERDIVRRLVSGTEVLDQSVGDIMTAEVRSVLPGDSLPHLMQTMTEHRIRHVPVVVEGTLAGIVSIGDVVKSRIGELEFERDQLESYVAGNQ